MWAPHETPEPVEKIKPSRAKLTTENTKHTQRAVDRLVKAREHLLAVGLHNGDVVHSIAAALKRFHELDPNVVIPFL